MTEAEVREIVEDGEVPDEERHGNVRRVIHAGAPRGKRRQRHGHVGCNVQRRELFQDSRLLGVAQPLVVPRHAGEARLEQLAQVAQFALHFAVAEVRPKLRRGCLAGHGRERRLRCRGGGRRRARHRARRGGWR